MKNISTAAAAFVGGIALWYLAYPYSASARQEPGTTTVARHQSPLACDRKALTTEQRKRHFDELGPSLRSRRKSVHELPDGFEFEFPGDEETFALLAEWVAGERVCCPFFEINVRAEPDSGALWLRLTGREGVKHFLEIEGSGWLNR